MKSEKATYLRHIILIITLFVVGSCVPRTSDSLHGEVKPMDTAEQHTNSDHPDSVSGQVINKDGDPLPGAVVRLQATTIHSLADQQGRFMISGLPLIEDLRLTAYAKGYFIKEVDTQGGSTDVKIILHSHAEEDHHEYEFLTAGLSKDGQDENTGCAQCHSATVSGDPVVLSLPYDEWQLDIHSQSSINPRFLSMYNGTDLSGNQSAPTRYVMDRDYGSLPIPPDPTKPYYGPGYVLDFPDSTGNCSSCHLPIMAINEPFHSDPNQAEGVALEGVNCDFCHKIWDINLNPTTGLPFPNMTGVLAYEFRRPEDGHQLFIGPLDDVAPGEDTFSPLQNQSQYCAGCHQAEFWGVPIYNSFGEWQSSSYADKESDNFQTCQDCHMPPLGLNRFARAEVGGLERNPDQIFSHRMPGAADEILLGNTAELTIETRFEANVLIVESSVFNNGAGHHIPTDSPLRQIFLIVEAYDKNGQALILNQGNQLPEWAGDLAGKPGIYFAKILRQLWTEVEPTGAYWTQTQIVEDTRLAAFETNKSDFEFTFEESESITIQAKLVFRRAFYDLMIQKGWNTPDIIMETVTISLP